MSIEQLLARAQDVRRETVDADGIPVIVREPTAAVHMHYALLWSQQKDEEAVAHLFRHCIVDGRGVACLNDEQALQLARASSTLAAPIYNAILRMSRSQKKADAPGADGMPDRPSPGASAV